MKIILIDEVNVHLEGFTDRVIETLRSKIRYREKDAHMQAAYKMGMWDGYTSTITEEGYTFFTELDKVVDILESYNLVNTDDIEIVDQRADRILPETIPPVDVDYIKEETGYPFREHQHLAVNVGLSERTGIFELATSSGKSLITAAISKALDPYTKTVVIVPYESLANQTYEDYEKFPQLSTLKLTSKIPIKKRKKAIEDHRHIIVTTKLFINCIEMFKDEHFALLVDETHIFGETLSDALRFEMAHCQFRLGLTATMPEEKKNPLKRANIIGCIGGDVISELSAKDLIKKGYASTVDIDMYELRHEEFEDIFNELAVDKRMDWSVEERYLWNNEERIEAICKFIDSLKLEDNTLILTMPQVGEKMVEIMGGTMISKDTSVDERDKLFSMFGSSDGAFQVASFGTSATGISENRIFNLILVDVGKDKTRILQSIGRGMRLDGERNHVNVIDISSSTIYSKKHRTERMKIYKDQSYPHRMVDFIKVE